MEKSLIIAEKPSVANDLSRVLEQDSKIGKFVKKDDYFENDKYIISSAIGHLVQQALPVTSEGKTIPWKFDCLPIIPDKFILEPSIQKGSKVRLNLLKKLMKRKDVTLIINACDAGREGELIFRYIIQFINVDKPIKRLWMQSMTDKSIKDSFSSLRSNDDMQPLSSAAYCRSESDWLIGINSTRALTAFNSKFGGFNKTPVGRVQTPTLAMLVLREKEIGEFVSEDYFEVHGIFGVKSGDYLGKWIDEGFKKSSSKPHDRADRIWDKKIADKIIKESEGKVATVEEKKKPSKQIAPQLYDLTSLQREANGRFGLSARRTLQIAQSLYERHKALTYPRTDSRYLPDDYVGIASKICTQLSSSKSKVIEGLSSSASKVLQNKWIKSTNKRVFNNSKVSDHFAIIPTEQIPNSLDDFEKKIYDMVTRRFVASFYPQAEFENTTRISRVIDNAFKTEGKVLVFPGWLEVYGKTINSNKSLKESKGQDFEIVPLQKNETATVNSLELLKKATKPPARYNEGTLLSAMETAGKLVSDDDLRDAMTDRGLGTPATRASIIEGLIEDKYVTRDGRDFFVSNRGVLLIDQLYNMNIDVLTSPELTGEWEYKLKQMEQSKLKRGKFMEEIKALTKNIVETTKSYAKSALDREWPDLEVPCPVCKAPSLGQDDGKYKCKEQDCKFILSKIFASRPLSEKEVKTLLIEKSVGPLTDFFNRFKKPFDASIELKEDDKIGLKAAFVFEKTDEEKDELDSIKPENNLCKCPLCDEGIIYQTPHSYVCDKRILENTCKARLSSNMCKYDIPKEQAIKYFTELKTDVIDQWISKRGKPFKASLVCNVKGKRMLGWEFPPKETIAKKKKVNKK